MPTLLFWQEYGADIVMRNVDISREASAGTITLVRRIWTSSQLPPLLVSIPTASIGTQTDPDTRDQIETQDRPSASF